MELETFTEKDWRRGKIYPPDSNVAVKLLKRLMVEKRMDLIRCLWDEEKIYPNVTSVWGLMMELELHNWDEKWEKELEEFFDCKIHNLFR